MVYVEDMGTILEIGLKELESFLESEEHSSAHPADVRNFQIVESSGPTVVLAFERRLDGQWKKSSSRITSFPPYCRCIEEFEGDFAGSRFVGIHRPDGARTRVDIFGDIQCKGKSPEETRTLWLAMLAKTYEEDVASLKRYRDRK
ncbi:MAG TPA: hypothetical protein VMG99_05225 [Thermoplasmata archaeon]|nr:hypothetical protein [Thermoplasmata archaeon]